MAAGRVGATQRPADRPAGAAAPPVTGHVNRARWALATVRWHLRLARDTGVLPTDVARIVLEALAKADDMLARYEAAE